jgi:hypothetical protein
MDMGTRHMIVWLAGAPPITRRSNYILLDECLSLESYRRLVRRTDTKQT